MTSFSAKTLEEAEQEAAKHFNISQEMLEIQVVQKPRRGFLGFGKRPAIIEASPAQRKAQSSKPTERPASQDKSAKQPVSPTKPAKAKSVNKGSYHSAKAKSHAAEHQTPKAKKKSPEELELERVAANHKRNLKRMRKAANGCCQYLEDVLRELGVAAKAQVSQLRAHSLTIDIKTSQSSKVIGYHGRQINALEVLGTAYLTYHGVHDPGLVLDTANYRDRRKKAIAKLADRCVTEVIATGQAVFLDPMPARERKEMHRLLEDNPKVKTYSHGREPFRSVVVVPNN